jgi:hypothetical protein
MRIFLRLVLFGSAALRGSVRLVVREVSPALLRLYQPLRARIFCLMFQCSEVVVIKSKMHIHVGQHILAHQPGRSSTDASHLVSISSCELALCAYLLF